LESELAQAKPVSESLAAPLSPEEAKRIKAMLEAMNREHSKVIPESDPPENGNNMDQNYTNETLKKMQDLLVSRMENPRPEIGDELMTLMSVWLVLHKGDGKACAKWKVAFLRWALKGRLRQFLFFLTRSNQAEKQSLLDELFHLTNNIPSGGGGIGGAWWTASYGWLKLEYIQSVESDKRTKQIENYANN
jgi:hypothetical protein